MLYQLPAHTRLDQHGNLSRSKLVFSVGLIKINYPYTSNHIGKTSVPSPSIKSFVFEVFAHKYIPNPCISDVKSHKNGHNLKRIVSACVMILVILLKI